MGNEIKEILNKLKDANWYNELDLTGTMWIELTWEETHLLLNYITNLEQKNERLTQGVALLTNKIIDMKREIGKLKKELNALKISEEEWLDETLGGDEE